MSIRKKPRKCRICKDEFWPQSIGHVVCWKNECIKAFIDLTAKKSDERHAKVERKEIARRKDAIRPRAYWLKRAQAAFNAFIRERDKHAGHACISSGKPLDWNGNRVDAGHYRSTGSAPHLRFDERNCHAQSKQDNRWLAGNAVDYRIGLVARIGLTAVESLESDNEPKKWTIEDLKQIEATYKAKLKVLKEIE